MRAGEVVKIRLSPADCMGMIDVLAKLGIDTRGMSVSSAASMAFSMMMEEMRAQGKIPRRHGFEYLQMMTVFKRNCNGSRKEKIQLSHDLYMRSMKGEIPSITGAMADGVQPVVLTPSPLSEAEQALIAEQLRSVGALDE